MHDDVSGVSVQQRGGPVSRGDARECWHEQHGARRTAGDYYINNDLVEGDIVFCQPEKKNFVERNPS